MASNNEPDDKTADGVAFEPGMTLFYYTVDEDRPVVKTLATDPMKKPEVHGDTVWINGYGVIGLFFSTRENLKEFLDKHRCFACHDPLIPTTPIPNSHDQIGGLESGLYFRSDGNWGSAELDLDEDGRIFEILICDDCMRNYRENISVYKRLREKGQRPRARR